MYFVFESDIIYDVKDSILKTIYDQHTHTCASKPVRTGVQLLCFALRHTHCTALYLLLQYML